VAFPIFFTRRRKPSLRPERKPALRVEWQAEQVVGMISKVRRLTPRARENIRRGLRNSWQPGGAHHARFRCGEPDADTARRRALDDRRGTLYAEVRTPDGQRWGLRWSVCGRTDQLDVMHAGRIAATMRPGLALEWIAERAAVTRACH
jgi:hypothetical protein